MVTTAAAAISSHATSYCPTNIESTTVSICESGLRVKINGNKKLFQTVNIEMRNTAAIPALDKG